MILASLVDLLELFFAQFEILVISRVKLIQVFLGSALFAGGGGDDALRTLQSPTKKDCRSGTLLVLGCDRSEGLVQRSIFGQGGLVEGSKGGVGHRDDTVLLLKGDELDVLFVGVDVGVLFIVYIGRFRRQEAEKESVSVCTLAIAE